MIDGKLTSASLDSEVSIHHIRFRCSPWSRALATVLNAASQTVADLQCDDNRQNQPIG